MFNSLVTIVMDSFAAILVWSLPISSSKLALVILSFIAATILAIVFTPVAMRLAHQADVLDHPHARRVHTRPTPRWGGLAMYAAFTLTVLVVMLIRLVRFDEMHAFNPRVLGILICGGLITALGAIDDKYSIPAKVKLLGQILIAVLLTLPFFGIRMVVAFDIPFVGDQLPLWREALSYILTVAWVVAITNTINLIDGLDGLAAGVSGLAALTFVTISVTMKGAFGEAILAAAVAGACLGFLRYNFNPAKVFMGDAGSHFLGFTIAALSILQNWKVATGIALAVPVLILAVPIFDTAFAIVRRLRRGQPIFSPDKGHLHHRLLNMGLNQRTVVLCIYILTVVGCLLALFLAQARLWH
ncbi:MAG: MraY family glycosyltransferase [Armatimonadota bacterium]